MSENEIGELKTTHADSLETLKKLKRAVPAGETASKEHHEKITKASEEIRSLERKISTAEREKGRQAAEEVEKK